MANNGWYKLENGRNGQSPGRSAPTSPGGRPAANRPAEKKAPETPAKAVPPVMAKTEYPSIQQQYRQRAEANIPVVPPPQPQPPKPLPEVGRDIKHSETVGERGPVLLQDTVLHETLETFIHSKRVDRVVHAKGFGAFGHFQVTHSMTEYTKAALFQKPGTQVPVLTRFSLAVSNKGTPDSGRNVRGFSTKFYTGEGPFDLLCNHIPVFLVRDAIRFPESIQAFLPSPVNNLADPERFWGFVSRAPEATHFVTWLYSDVGTIKSLRKIRASSVNTYVWQNAEGVRHYVKYHWIPVAGEEYITRQEAGKLAGENPDVAGQDLYDTIAKGTPVEYNLMVQLMEPADEEFLSYDPLDDTKTWDEEQYPLFPVGRLVLNKNPENYNEQIEKVAFSPANLMEGIELSDDKMLQGRSTVYWDAQRFRLGPDFRTIPINKEAGFKPGDLVTSGLGQHVEGREMRSDLIKTNNFAQAGERYNSLSPEDQEHLVDNIAVELPLVSKATQTTVLGYFRQACPEFADRVAKQMELYEKK